MKPPRTLAFIAGCVLVLILAACAAQTSTPEAPGVTATPQPYPVAVSPTAAMAPMAYPAPATDTPAPIATATPTRLPSPTETPRPTQTDTPTPAPTPQVWEIWFKAFSCGQNSSCEASPDATYSVYSIQSDGTALKQSSIAVLPTIPALPTNAPPQDRRFAFPEPHLSLDGDFLVYSAYDKDTFLPVLHVLSVKTEQVVASFYPPKEDGKSWSLGPACWLSDGTAIRFLGETRAGNTRQRSLFAINGDGSQFRELFALPTNVIVYMGSCSPDGQEMALYTPGLEPDKTGLLLVNLNSKAERLILPKYHIVDIRSAPHVP